MNELIEQVGEIITDDELIKTLSVLPVIKKDFETKSERLIALLDVYKIYIPNSKTVDIYNRLYFGLISSLEKKSTKSEKQAYYQIGQIKKYGVIGGLDSFVLTGNSGVGKTSAVERCIDVIANNKVLMVTETNREIIPFLFVECPSDGSFKGLLYSIMQKVDLAIGTNYLKSNSSKSITADHLLNVVSVILINHIGMLVVDEIERIANDKIKGTTLINYLTQLINQTNISVCFVGDESSNAFFASRDYLGRRAIGINIEKFDFDEHYYSFCETLFKYQFTEKQKSIDEGLLKTIYELTDGVPANIVSLFVETQKRAILNDEKAINSVLFNDTFEELFANVRKGESTQRKVQSNLKYKPNGVNIEFFSSLIKDSKKDVDCAISLLKKEVVIELVKL